MNEELQLLLIEMKNADIELRTEILKHGNLYEGYSEEMEALHVMHARKLKQIIDEYGWPGKSLVGKEGATAAFLIAQHSISCPELQCFFLSEIKQAVIKDEAHAIQEACLEDRILYNQGKPGKYGMLFDWDESGELIACVDDEEAVNARRAELGLLTLSEALAAHKKEVFEEGGGPPTNVIEHKRKAQEWAERVGWR